MNGEIVRQLDDNGHTIILRMHMFNIQGRLVCTSSIDGPKEMTEEQAQWIAQQLKTAFNSEGNAIW